MKRKAYGEIEVERHGKGLEEGPALRLDLDFGQAVALRLNVDRRKEVVAAWMVMMMLAWWWNVGRRKRRLKVVLVQAESENTRIGFQEGKVGDLAVAFSLPLCSNSS